MAASSMHFLVLVKTIVNACIALQPGWGTCTKSGGQQGRSPDCILKGRLRDELRSAPAHATGQKTESSGQQPASTGPQEGFCSR